MRDRRRAERAGRHGERVALVLLRLKGYRILAHRFRSPVGEIDIVAARGPVLAFVEVKARATHAAAADAILAAQRQRIARGAEAFIRQRPQYGGHSVRFDAMLVIPWRAPTHVVDAWRT